MLVQAAVALGLEDGAKLRVDTTVVETDIHHPTDNTLLWDVVRVVTRLVGRLAKALKMRRIKGFRDRRRSAHRRMYEIQRMTTRQRPDRQTATYRALIGIAEEVVASAKAALEKTAMMRGKDLFAAMAIDAIRDEIAHYCGLGERVIDQARRRVLDGEQVPNAVKIVCIPQRGGSKTPQRQAYERSAAFKQGQRFRAGIEGRISVLMRGRGMKRCRAEGAERFALFVAAAVLANNLMIVAALLTKRSSRRSKAAR